MFSISLSVPTLRWSRLVFSVVTLVALLFGLLVPAADAAGHESRVFPDLQKQAAKYPTKRFRVIITQQKARDVADARDVRGAGGKFLRKLPHNAFVAELPGRAIRALGRHPGVKYISVDAPIMEACQDCAAVSPALLATMFPKASGASGLWPVIANGTGWTGKGVGVAVLDTGINPNRLDWNDAQGASRIISAPLFSSSSEKRDDGHGHGTHVAGIIGANSWHRPGLTVKGKYVGVAPEATLIDVKVSDDRGASYVSDLVMAIDWVVENRQAYNIRVMNMSLVSSVAESYKTSVLAAAAERAWFNGILVVVAAGNAGPDTLGYPPANDPFVITVGATDTMGTVSTSDDTITEWSSYGVTQDGFSKPDLVAPGRQIIAPLTSASSTLGREMSGRIVDGSYIWLSGTSMATPVVAGVAALAFQAHPEWTNDQVKWLLTRTASPLMSKSLLGLLSKPLPGSGAGAVNARPVVTYSGTPQFANQGLTPNEHLIGPDGNPEYNSAASWSTASWSTASWSTASWSTASWSTASWSTASWSTASWSTSSNVVSCDTSCDATDDDTLPAGTIIPFEDPAVELGLPAELVVVAP